MANSFSIFDWFLLAMGIYVLYGGITGKGRLYATDNVKEGMEAKFKKFSRISYSVLGVVMSLNAGASLLKTTFYEFKEITPATDVAKAVNGWVLSQDLGAFSFLTAQVLDILTYVFLGLCLAIVVVLMIGIRKMTDRNAPPKGQSDAQKAAADKQAGHVLPVSAFDFQEDDNDGQAE
ncbi:MAG: hypothetical protein RRZ24_04800 [Clostridia bacterium]